MILITWIYKTDPAKTELTNILTKDEVHKAIKQGSYLPPNNWDYYELTWSTK